MHVPFPQHQSQLVLGKIGIDQRERDAMESQIPSGIPGILPFVRHGDDVGVVEMGPLAIAAPAAVLFDQLSVRKLGLGILVKVLHVGVGGRAVKVEIVLLYILSMITFAPRQTEETLLQNGILAVPS